MLFQKLKTQKTVNVNISKYLINWEGDCRSKFQKNVKLWLKPYWKHDICLEELLIPGSRMTCDLVNLSKKIVLEVSGDQHLDFNPYFHNNCRMQWHAQILRDANKQTWSEQNGFTFVEIYPEDLPLSAKFFKDKYDIDLI